MAEFWRLIAPVKITITMDKSEYDELGKDESPLSISYTDDYKEVSCDKWSDEDPFLGTRHKVTLTYMLPDEKIDQIKAFIKDAWKLIGDLQESALPDGLDTFITSHLESLDMSSSQLDTVENRLEEISDNSYLQFQEIPSLMVYQGWPGLLYSESRLYSLQGFIFLTSKNNLNLSPEESILFKTIKHEIHLKLHKAYTIAKYIQNFGF